MQMINRVKKYSKMFLWSIVFLICSLVAYAIVIVIASYIPVNVNVVASTEDCVEVYIRSNGVHTDIVVPIKNDIKDWSGQLDSKKTKAGKIDYDYVGVGWGDKGFYLDTPTWGDLTFKTAFKALFYLGTSAMHVTFYKGLHESERCKKIFISKESYQQIVAYIESSFVLDEKGACILIENASYWDNDSFYDAKGKYGIFYTCNTWTNNSLKAGNLKACLWTLFDYPIFFHYK